jgi:hypothetical protein
MIQTKIAKILSPTRVVLSAGAEHGVQEGMVFVIYELGDAVQDPENGEPLGQLELHKARIKVVQVQERLSVATTLPRQVERTRLQISDIFAPYTETVYPRLPLEESVATAVAEERKLTVKVGDLARSLD